MNKKLTASARAYAKNLGQHLRRVVKGVESPFEAVSGIARDTRKLKRSAKRSAPKEGRQEAADLTEAGRKAYNTKDYKTAEHYFRQAAAADPQYALPLTYLGNALYKQGNQADAVNCWKRAILTDPDSEAADNARGKLERLNQQAQRTVEQLEKNLRES